MPPAARTGPIHGRSPARNPTVLAAFIRSARRQVAARPPELEYGPGFPHFPEPAPADRRHWDRDFRDTCAATQGLKPIKKHRIHPPRRPCPIAACVRRRSTDTRRRDPAPSVDIRRHGRDGSQVRFGNPGRGVRRGEIADEHKAPLWANASTQGGGFNSARTHIRRWGPGTCRAMRRLRRTTPPLFDANDGLAPALSAKVGCKSQVSPRQCGGRGPAPVPRSPRRPQDGLDASAHRTCSPMESTGCLRRGDAEPASWNKTAGASTLPVTAPLRAL